MRLIYLKESVKLSKSTEDEINLSEKYISVNYMNSFMHKNQL